MSAQKLIQHVVLIIKENHTFDNYFGTFPGVAGDATLSHAPDPPPSDPPHDHGAWLKRAQGAVKQQYRESDIPAYFAYARQFTLCDNYFTDVASQSEPNHLMLIAADSPIIDNANPRRKYQPQAPFDIPSLPANLAKAGLTWKAYGDAKFSYFNHITALQGSPNIVSWKQFDLDAAAGKLPSVSWLLADSLHDEHPPFGVNAGKPTVRLGMQWTVARVNALAKSKHWGSTALFITYDDWGGWADHVVPPSVEKWAGAGPPKGVAYKGTQFRFGSRVPCLVMGPFAKPGFISKAFHSHVSVVKFCETTFGLPTLTARDAAADDMSDCFDFTQKPLPPPAAAPGGKPKPKPKPQGKK